MLTQKEGDLKNFGLCCVGGLFCRPDIVLFYDFVLDRSKVKGKEREVEDWEEKKRLKLENK